MAKLAANGTELARISRETQTPNNSLTIWERKTISYRSNGAVLTKLDVRFRPEARPYPGEENGRYYSYGWKKAARAHKMGITQLCDIVARRIDAAKDYIVEYKSPYVLLETER